MYIALRLGTYMYQNDFIGTNFNCLVKQPFSDLHQMASLLLSKCCIKGL